MTSGIRVCIHRAVVGCAIAAVSGSAHAQFTTVEWAAPVSGSYTVASNWLTMDVPDRPLDIPTLGLAGPYSVLFDASYAQIQGMVITNPEATMLIGPPVAIGGTALLEVAGATGLTNNGLVRIAGGGPMGHGSKLQFDGPITLAGSGELRLESEYGAVVVANNGVTNGPDHRITGQGRFQTTTGSIGRVFNNGLIVADVPGRHLSFGGENRAVIRAVNGGILSTMNVNQTRGATPGLIDVDGGVFEFDGIVEGGTVRAVNGGYVTNPRLQLTDGVRSTVSSVHAEGDWRFKPSQTYTLVGLAIWGGGITNDGTIRLLADPTTTHRVRIEVSNGIVLSGSGEVLLEEAGDTELDIVRFATNGAMHRISGIGTIIGEQDGQLRNAGTIAPGLPVGTLKSTYPIAFQPTGVLEIELAGTGPGQHDLLDATGAAVTLNGWLDAHVRDGFEMPPCTHIAIVKGGISGVFSFVTLPPAPQGKVAVVYSATQVSLIYIPGDLNGDGLLDFADYLEFLTLFDAQSPRADLNGDGIIDFSDYLEFLTLFDTGC